MLNKYGNSRIAIFEIYFIDIYNFLENYYYNLDLDLDRNLDYYDNIFLFFNNYSFDYNFFYDAISIN